MAAEVKDRLDTLGTYEVEVEELGGDYVFVLESDEDERWALWVSGKHLVKLGAPAGRDLPDDLVDTYVDLYPSDLDEHGRARSGTASSGRSRRQEAEDEELEILSTSEKARRAESSGGLAPRPPRAEQSSAALP